MQIALATQPESIFRLVKRSLKLYCKGLPRVFLFSLILSIIVFIPRLSTLIIDQKVNSSFLFEGNGRFWLIPIIELCVLFIFTAMLWRMRCVLYQENESIFADMRIALRKLPNIVVVAIIQAIIISFLITSSLIFGFYAQAMSVTANGVPGQAPFFTAIFLAFNAWLAIYLYNLLIFYLPLILTEDKGILTSIEKSIVLVWGNWWRTFLFLLIPWVAYIVLLLFIRNLFHLALNIYFVTPLPESSWFATILHIFLFAIFIPWVAAALLIQLRDLELRKKIR